MIDENSLKEAFLKIKEDILFLQQELIILKQEIAEINHQLGYLLNKVISTTEPQHPTHFPTHNFKNYGLNQQYFHSSIGNEGVPTDRQQTDNGHKVELKRTFKISSSEQGKLMEGTESQQVPSLSIVMNALKQNLGEKFKKLTKQEFLIFSIIYTLDEELGKVTYADISQRTNLTESSIRDYVGRLIHKGIPILKEKVNNKTVVLKIPKELKEIATLDKLSKLNEYQNQNQRYKI
ncbi:MAG: hypothetical protein QW622_03290 [Candidatus Pacearchaeota archaeon]